MTRARTVGRHLVLAALFALGVAGTACANGGGRSEAQQTTDDQAAFNAVDSHFAGMMIPHHEMAIEMAELASEQAQMTEIKTLAGQMVEAQRAEIATLETFLDTFEAQPVKQPKALLDMDEMMTGQLKTASGEEFDMMFLEMMMHHHRGAIDAADFEIEGGQHQDTIELAEAIKTDQLREISEMQELMGGSSGDAEHEGM